MTLPLAGASARLRGRPGRPRTRPERPPAPKVEVARVAPLAPLLVDVQGGCALLGGVSPDVIRDYIARGVLRPVRLPGANGRDLRRILLAVADVVALVEASKDEGAR